MIPFFLMPASFQKRIAEERERARERRLAICKPWDGTWAEELNVVASSYPIPIDLFPAVPPDVHASSPSGRFRYTKRTLPRGTKLDVSRGSKRGAVLFDGPVAIPVLEEAPKWGVEWNVWMSLAPMEVLTLACGTRFAKGHTVVGGLGLGWQLREVSRRRQVKRITLIEREKELIDWLYPRIAPLLGPAPVEVVCGTVEKVLPKLEADVALIDTFDSYGNNGEDLNRLRRSAPSIRGWWGWGTAAIGEREEW